MIISIVAAIGKNGLIGKGDSLPWFLPADLKHFKELTMGKTLIMGSRTFDALGALKGRKFIVLTLDKDRKYDMEDCRAAYSINEALKMVENEEEVMIAGGASVYKQFLPLAQKMYLTFIEHDFDGDIYFPEYDLNEWEEVERVKVEKDEKNLYSCSFVTFKKK